MPCEKFRCINIISIFNILLFNSKILLFLENNLLKEKSPSAKYLKGFNINGLVEAARFELASKDISVRTATSVVYNLVLALFTSHRQDVN